MAAMIALVALVAASSAPAQGITLLRQFAPGDPPTFAFPPGIAPEPEYSMCSGLRHPATGVELAIAGADNGLLFAHVPEPRHSRDDLAQAVATTWFFADGPASRWRGIATFRDRVYAVSYRRAGIRQFRVDPLAGPQVGWIEDLGLSAEGDFAAGGPRTAVDARHGLLYALGISRLTQRAAVFVYRLLDPSNGHPFASPQLLAEWDPGGVVFDVCLRGNRAYMALLKPGSPDWWRVADVSGLWIAPPAQPRDWRPPYTEWRNTLTTPGSLSHDSYVTPDESMWFATVEGYGLGGHTTGRPLWTAPVLNDGPMAEPPVHGSYQLVQSGVEEPIHSLRGIGRTGYVSHWSAGLHVVDLGADRVGIDDFPLLCSYDTTPLLSTAIADGVWDCHPFQDSGVTYVTDSERGLFLLRLDRGHWNRYGRGRSNGATVPRIEGNARPPRIGTTYRMEVTGMQPLAAGAVVLGLREDPSYLAGRPVTVQGADVLVDFAGASAALLLADGDGTAIHSMGIPDDPQLVGRKVFAQVFEFVGVVALATSRGHWFGIAP